MRASLHRTHFFLILLDLSTHESYGAKSDKSGSNADETNGGKQPREILAKQVSKREQERHVGHRARKYPGQKMCCRHMHRAGEKRDNGTECAGVLCEKETRSTEALEERI